MTSKLHSLLKEKINENIKVHRTIDKNFSEFDTYKIGKLEKLPIDIIKPNLSQPRLIFDESELTNLANSIKELGLLQPIIVRKNESNYEIVAGERRYRACKLLDKKYIDAIIIVTTEENNVLLALAENISRADLTDFEIAISILQFKDKFPSKTEYAKALGISRQKLYKLLAFETLPNTVVEKIKSNPGLISADTAEKLNSLGKNANVDENVINKAILEGISLIEEKRLKQIDLIGYIQEKLIDCPKSDTLNSECIDNNHFLTKKENDVRRIYQSGGKTVGRIGTNSKKLIIELDSLWLDEKKQQKIEHFFDDLFQ